MDSLIFNLLNGFALKNFWLDTLAIFLAKYLPYVLIGVLFLFLLRNFKKYWRMIAQALSSLILCLVITEIIRLLWLRPRPFVGNAVHLLLTHSPAGSFPSQHATIFFAISTVIYFHNKKAGILFFVASFLMGISRIFCGLHWPSDILGGIAIGILSGILVHNVFRRKFSKQEVIGK